MSCVKILYLVLLALCGCGGDPYPDAPERVQGFVVPPYPGAAGGEGLDGVDSNNNGVRDDVERWILLEWGDDLDKRCLKLSFLRARSLQRCLHQTDSKEEAIAFSAEDFFIFAAKENACAQLWGGDIITAVDQHVLHDVVLFQKKLERAVLNTRERRQAYAQYKELLGGRSYDSIPRTEEIEFFVESIRSQWDAEQGVVSEPLEDLAPYWQSKR